MGHLGIAEASQQLSAVGWLAQVPPAFRDRVLEVCHLIQVDRRQPVYSVGDPIGGPYGVADGAVSVEISPYDDAPHIGYVGTRGFWFGEVSLIAQQPRIVGVVATRPTTLLHLPAHAFEEIAAEDPLAWRYLALMTTRMVANAIGVVDDMMIPSSRARVAAILLTLSGCRAADPDDEAPALDLTHEEVGRLANLSRSRLATILRDLRTAELIDCSYRTIRLTDPAGLRALLRESHAEE
ncbi:Crp/Fnr family transcriptional regulator [Acuticoccus sp. I52.16.1]|uniref:Crp/Fnr family transcriptional regulator n=1 Tax=Acuticoccus sp. I52.16.1 TaxID=2928472 RepID=UPI001FD218D4|nr:Crp/Fnr family transcriptional regulator [Acuticoccus sp. I52.16.1]UOM35631.1 Crp/Fnr family transcriptional regulator [Acuticoccus sp. I52.16.1]